MREPRQLSDYTEEEFLDLVTKICRADAPSESELDALVDHFEEITEHPDGADLIYYYPEIEQDGTRVSNVRIVKEWRASQGLSGLKHCP
ncbi:colicin immunity protein [Enterovibrio norvegicus FF-33]|uniref:bacteriocin immunity protein n=1 Tax=Enterovibrio TaxID=188143 RepID=UPI0002F3C721|nr:bacteriocin immunity protein [Enterovibrio norvegicus]OEE70246.1 colicin immunity protein [Enterovibrio norvegicus FF-33]OEE88857.1 colicin immunity protein [Enterovibrio norvegicus FF-162]